MLDITCCVYLATRVHLIAGPPSLGTISHTGCSVSGSTLIGCPPGGGGTLTLTGGNLYGGGLTLNAGCSGALTQNPPSFNQLTCTLAGGAVGGNTGVLQVTTYGGISAAGSLVIYYGMKYC